MIAVLDYGMGNLRSVAKALEHVGADVLITSDAYEAGSADAVVLPGVGAFARCMNNLEAAGLAPVVRDALDSGKPFLGICVGMQILFERSEEFGTVDGLGILPGTVRRFDTGNEQAGLKVPHMGWNEIQMQRRAPLLSGIEDGARTYFVHSFYVETENQEIVSTTTDYGARFVSSVWRDNLFATQFHPEKSQAIGLKLLANFAAQAVREAR